MVLGVILSLLTALTKSFSDVASKKNLAKINEYIVAFSLKIIAAICIIPYIIYSGIPELNQNFVQALLVSGTLNAVTIVLYMKALKKSDLSLSVTFLAFTPLFLLITSPLIVGEFPSMGGIVGIFLIVIGTYVLKIKDKHLGFLAPFKSLLQHEGPKLMLIVAFIFSITANFDKIGVVNSTPLFWVFAMNLFSALLLIPFLYLKKINVIPEIKKNYLILLLPGILTSLSNGLQMTAISLTLVAYVISIKRSTSIFSTIFGYFFFKEKEIKERLIGTSIMVLGVIIIGISSI